MPRKALIGTSSPIGYDYRNPAGKVISDSKSSPNPILESPFGTLLLYDEIWFLCRSLCPENMRNLDYVHFVDEEIGIPDTIGQLDWKELDALKDTEEWKNIFNTKKTVHIRDLFNKGFENYGVTWENAIDNHTHAINIGSISAHGNPTEDRLLFDLVLSDALNMSDHELITNTCTHSMLSKQDGEMVSPQQFAEYMIIKDIPNYLSKLGPYHPTIDEARENPYLKDFRKWIINSSTSTSLAELKEVKEAVEASMQEMQDKLFMKYLDPSSFYKSLGASVIGDGIGLLIPGTSTVQTVVEHVDNRKEKEQMRWQGFLVSMKGKI